MFVQCLFTLVSRLIGSRWVRDYAEQHGPCEDATTGRLGVLHLEVNRCFVLDHEDTGISIHLPIPIRHAQSLHRASRGGWHWSRLHLGYVVCLGTETIRQPGFYWRWQKQLPQLTKSEASQPGNSNAEEIPF